MFYGLCVAGLCVAPLFLDATVCDELYAAPLHQPAMVDGEEAHPFKAAITPVFLDHQATAIVLLPTQKPDDHRVHPGSSTGSVPQVLLFDLISRPPPFS